LGVQWCLGVNECGEVVLIAGIVIMLGVFSARRVLGLVLIVELSLDLLVPTCFLAYILYE